LRAPIFTLFPYTTLFRSQFERLLDVFRFRHLARSPCFSPEPNDRADADVEGAIGQLGELLRFLEHFEQIDADLNRRPACFAAETDRKSTRLNSSHDQISY